jgi:hypothetical protein
LKVGFLAMVYCLLLVEKVVAFVAHARIPHFGIGFPGITSELVGVVCHEGSFTIKKKCSFADVIR